MQAVIKIEDISKNPVVIILDMQYNNQYNPYGAVNSGLL